MIHHVGILVEDFRPAELLLGHLGYNFLQSLYVPEFFCDCNLYEYREAAGYSIVTKVELVKPRSGPLLRRMNVVGSGTHHIAFGVNDIEATTYWLKRNGYELLRDRPVIGVDNTLVNFIMPGKVGVLFEVVQKIW